MNVFRTLEYPLSSAVQNTILFRLPYFQTQLTPAPRGENGGSLEPLIFIDFDQIFLGAPPPDPRTYLQSDFSYDILRGKNQEFSLIFTKIFLGAPPPDSHTFLQSDFSYDILREKNQ